MVNSLCVGTYSSLTGKNWSESRDKKEITKYDTSPCVAKILASIKTDNLESFLDSRIKKHMTDPYALLNMDKAVSCIISAMDGKRKITVFGDYDTDGVTSSALLKNYMRALGYEISVYIPDRITEGYGPSIKAFKSLLAAGTQLCITVDCGTSAYEAAAFARDNNLDLLIIDHHINEQEAPHAVAVVNPNGLGDVSGYDYLAAVGVTFLVIAAVNARLRETGFFNKTIKEPDLYSMLDLVALGTVCDVVPLRGMNRAFVASGLKVLKKTVNVGLEMLSKSARFAGDPDAQYLGFVLGPRINAAGRLGKALTCVELLTCEDHVIAAELARELEGLNKARRLVEADVLQEALGQIKSCDYDQKDRFIIIYGDNWHCGVIGIVAGRIKELTGLPVVIIAFEGDTGKASIRSLEGLNCGKAAIAALKEGLLISAGGHGMAGGFTVHRAKLKDFMIFWHQYFAGKVNYAVTESLQREYCGELSLADLNADLMSWLGRLAPYGRDNPEPLFLIKSVAFCNLKIIAERHASFKVYAKILSGETVFFDAIAFDAVRKGIYDYLYRDGKDISLICSLSYDSYTGVKRIVLTIYDVLL